MDIDLIKNKIRNIPNFPMPGIQYKDITPLLQNYETFQGVISLFSEEFSRKKIDVIVGIESRGFIFAAALALKLECSFALARKKGKLPYKVVSQNYELEYGTDTLEMHVDGIEKDQNVLIIDDLLATGGTAEAVGSLVNQLEGNIVSYAFMIELVGLNGSKKVNPIFSLIKY
tara:strand:+ start:307 stop:822 length:516 start_codon:yes stop_codon:yes gene_type:complete